MREDASEHDEDVEEWSEGDELQWDIDDWLGLDSDMADEATAKDRGIQAIMPVVIVLTAMGSCSYSVFSDIVTQRREPSLVVVFPVLLLVASIVVAKRFLPIAFRALGRRKSVEGRPELRRRVGGSDDEMELVIGLESFRVPADGHEALDLDWNYRATWVGAARRLVSLEPIERVAGTPRQRDVIEERRRELWGDVFEWLDLDEDLAWLSDEPEEGRNSRLRMRGLALPALGAIAALAIVAYVAAFFGPWIAALAFTFVAWRALPALRALPDSLRDVGQLEGPVSLKRTWTGGLELVIGSESFRVPSKGSEALDTSWIWRATWLPSSRRLVELEPVRPQ